MTRPDSEPCPTCDGSGEITECANDGTHGCSHTNDAAWPCPTCTAPTWPTDNGRIHQNGQADCRAWEAT